EIKYDVMIFVDARKTDHLIPSEKISDILNSLCNDGYSILVVSGRESSQRISELNINPGSGVEFAYSPPLDELIRLIKQSKSVIVANTGIMHLSVALGTPTCGIFVNANPYVWGYQMNPHLMIDAREKGIDINQVVNFVRCSITKF
ncbi:MAG: hypothetical protein N3B13_05065, partial [Deltaproteobacteria bacterium]|nr:hypothetical protein [Deltaproteobacteria bacterium]